MIRRSYIILIVFLLSSISHAQDISFAREVVDVLASPAMHGRGYVKGGDKKASYFISEVYTEIQLKSFGKDYLQELSFPINTFPGKMNVEVDERMFTPGADFVVSSSSPGIKGSYEVVWLQDKQDSTWWETELRGAPLTDKFVVTDIDYTELVEQNPYGSRGVIVLVDSTENLWWHVSNGNVMKDYTIISMRSHLIDRYAHEISVDIANKYIPKYLSNNIIGYVRGSAQPDSFIVITAHYDHLGRMGKYTYFPGANDNASGVAMMLDLARYYTTEENKPAYSIVFIALCGEETGLNGSRYFVENPLFPLDNIRFLVNLDMVGTGSAGITVVNGAIFEEEFEKLTKINRKMLLLRDIKARGESCNSDHCPFYEKGVPSFFMYTTGKEYNEYHNIYDDAYFLPFTEYHDLFTLVTEFITNITQ